LSVDGILLAPDVVLLAAVKLTIRSSNRGSLRTHHLVRIVVFLYLLCNSSTS